MNLSFAYPSVPVFLQSSILLNKGEDRGSTPTETALGAFQIAAAQLRRGPGAHNCAQCAQEYKFFGTTKDG